MATKDTRAKLSKREKFEEAGRFPLKKVLLIALAAVIVVGGGVTGYVLGTRAPAVGGQVVEQGGADYSGGGTVEMVRLGDPTVNSDSVVLSLADVKAKKIGGLVYERTNAMPAGYDDIGTNGLPVLAYVAPSGKLVVASSLCEPCHSYNFHIEGNDLVCNACFTHWDLDTLQGISGGCQAYPPSELKTTVNGDNVQIQKSALESWTPRI
jgi:hypothetical protein